MAYRADSRPRKSWMAAFLLCFSFMCFLNICVCVLCNFEHDGEKGMLANDMIFSLWRMNGRD